MKPTIRSLIAGALLLTWLGITLQLWSLASQRNFVQSFFFRGPAEFIGSAARIVAWRYAGDLLLAWLGAILFSAACIAIGMILIGRSAVLQINGLATVLTALALGEAILSVVLLTVIMVYGLSPAITFAILLLGVLLGWRPLAGLVGQLARIRFLASLRPLDKVVLGLTIAVLVSASLYSSARLSYDAVTEYFTHAKIMAMSGKPILLYPADAFVVSSFHPAILYTAAIQLFGDQAARMLSWVNGLAIVLWGVAIGEEIGTTSRARLWFAAMMLSSTAFVDLLGDGKLELVSTAPLLAAIFWLLRSLKTPGRSLFLVTGCLTGFAMIARPYNIFLAAAFVACFGLVFVMLAPAATGFDRKAFLTTSLWMLPPLVALGAFHLWQNWLWLGNALAPLILGRQVTSSIWQWQFDPRLLNLYRVLYPFIATFLNSPQSLGDITPLFVGCLPLLFLGVVRKDLRQRPRLMQLCLVAAVTLVLWLAFFFTVVEIRYIFFLWVVLFLVVAQIMDSAAEHPELPVRTVLSLLVALLLAYVGGRTVLVALGTYSPVDSAGRAYCYDFPFCSFLDPVNRVAAPGDRVFVLNAFRYYLRPDLFACSSRAQEYPRLEGLARENPPEFWVQLYRDGFRYITYETNFATFHSRFGPLPPADRAPGWLHVTTIASMPDGLESIYRIDASDPPFQPVTSCRSAAAGQWQVK